HSSPASYLATRAVLRQGLMLRHRAPRNKASSEVLPHRWVKETVCGNTNLSPWWRKPLLIHCILLSVYKVYGPWLSVKCASHLWNLLSSLVSRVGDIFIS
ncbi:hypothetical protein K5549_020790, partial [Capra hircus]|uniref:Uncharacterized protein n=1 Tax=Capra hircus TaxID=9925 RepID=A0A452ESR9_CAPHI